MFVNKYNLAEIFYSLQGEGFWAGTPVVFVRFAGCNLECTFCDTNHSNKIGLDADQLVHIINNYPAKRVVFTGGEPLLQLDENLIDQLRELHIAIHVETNGTIAPPAGISFMTVSPKKKWVVKYGEELKVVYLGQDLEQYFIGTKFEHYFLQPCSMSNIQEVIDICKKDPRWRLSLQTQKMVNIR